MNKNIKLLILINDLSFFYSHRLPIAIASKSEGFDVVIGYGDLGGADPKILTNKGINTLQGSTSTSLTFFPNILHKRTYFS